MAKRESREELKARAARISKTLARLYPEARISLDFKTPWQCLAATIMSAQCTDERVNQVTPALFAKYPDPAAMAAADTRDVERMIVSTGFLSSEDQIAQGRRARHRRALRQPASRHDGGPRHLARSGAQDRQRRARSCAWKARPGGRYACSARVVSTWADQKPRARSYRAGPVRDPAAERLDAVFDAPHSARPTGLQGAEPAMYGVRTASRLPASGRQSSPADTNVAARKRKPAAAK